MLDDDVMVARRSDLLWRVAPGYLVVTTLEDETREADGPAPEIWRSIDQSISIGGLIASLAETYALAPEQIRDDVIAFLSDLVVAGLVKVDG